MSIIVAYLFLSIAIVTEVIGTIYLRDTEGFTRLTPSVITAVSYAASFYFISLTLKQIPVAVTYAIWSGVGLVLINIFAAIKYGQMPNSITTLGMAFIILGGVLVNFNTGVD